MGYLSQTKFDHLKPVGREMQLAIRAVNLEKFTVSLHARDQLITVSYKNWTIENFLDEIYLLQVYLPFEQCLTRLGSDFFSIPT